MMSNSQFTREHEATFNRIVYRALLIPIGVMVIATLLLAYLGSHLFTVTDWLDHTDKVIAEANNCERLILNQQTAMRGYLLTGNPELLRSFNQIGVEISPVLADLNKEIGDNPGQGKRLQTLQHEYREWARYASNVISRRQKGADYQSAEVQTGEMALMTPIRDDFQGFNEAEENLRVQRSTRVQNLQSNIRRLRWFVLLGLGVCIGLYVRDQLRRVARLYEEILLIAQQKTAALKASEESLLEAQATLRTHANDLEKTVMQRTAQLRETVTELESYSYSVSHDLRAPLRAVRGYAEVMMEDYGEQIDGKGKVYLQRMMTACDRMDALIQDVLTYSQLGRTEIHSEPVDLEKLLCDIIQHYPALQKVDSQIKVESPLPGINAPPALLSQCLSNLLNNAVKFAREGVPIEVRVRAETHGKDVRIWVEDNGIGIPPQYREKIFGVFERIPGEKTHEGTGIGLAIVRKAAERMGGKTGVESEHKGSRFWIDLPGRKI